VGTILVSMMVEIKLFFSYILHMTAIKKGKKNIWKYPQVANNQRAEKLINH
jgi:hypothetical protein